MKLFFILALLLLLSSCSEESYPPPTCRIDLEAISVPLVSERPVNAACLVKIDKRLLVIERTSGLYDLALSYSLSSHAESKLIEPVFFNEYLLSDEHSTATTQYEAATSLAISSACAAHQATWYQGGFNVKVGARLVSRPIVSTGHEIVIYACQLQAGYDGSEPSIQAPPWQEDDVKKMIYINPFEVEQDQWANPDHFIAVRDAFIDAPSSAPALSQIPDDKKE